MNRIKLFTIGFTRKNAESFFNLLTEAGVKRIVDVRLNNVSQLAGFAKRDDLKFFLKTIGHMDYIHMPELSPSKDLLENFKKKKTDWAVYEKTYLELMAERKIAITMQDRIKDADCLLCSEDQPDCCHRRLAAEYLQGEWGNMDIRHLM